MGKGNSVQNWILLGGSPRDELSLSAFKNMAMLDRGATAQPIEYTDPGDPRNNWWHHRNPKCRIVASIATFAASMILLVVSFAVNSTSMQQVQLPAAGMCAFSGLSLAIWLYRQYCTRREVRWEEIELTSSRMAP